MQPHCRSPLLCLRSLPSASKLSKGKRKIHKKEETVGFLLFVRLRQYSPPGKRVPRKTAAGQPTHYAIPNSCLESFSMHQLIQQRIDNGRGYIRAALAASRDDIRRVPADEQLLRLDHVDKSDRHTDDKRRRDNAFLNQLVQTDKRSRRIADGEEERASNLAACSIETTARVTPRALASLATCSSAIRQTPFRRALPASPCSLRRAPYWYR